MRGVNDVGGIRDSFKGAESVKIMDFLTEEDLMCSRVSRIARASAVKIEA